MIYKNREDEIANSIGSICSQCNTTAYYFSQKNTSFDQEKTCMICSNEHTDGILLEDFIFTLSQHIPNHYNCTENNSSSSISLYEILARFTYNNDKVIDNLMRLLCNKSPDFFKTNGRYIEVLDDSIIESYKKSAIDEWHDISKEVKHTRRFTNTKAIQFYERLIGNCLFNIKADKADKADNIEINTALTKIDKGKSLFRGRVVKNKDHRETISKNPQRELSAPPESLAASNRMSPSGISFMYTAGDYETAIAELRPYVGDIIAIGEFITSKPLNFFDFTLLENAKIRQLNILENPRDSRFLRSRYLLNELHKFISKPVRPSDVTYIDLQIFSETIRNYNKCMFDGIIFKSSQRPEGINYVIFGNHNEKEDTKNYHVSLGNNCNVNFYEVNKVLTVTEKIEQE